MYENKDQEIITYCNAKVNGESLFTESDYTIKRVKNKDESLKIVSFNGVIVGEYKKAEKPVIFSGETLENTAI